MTAQVLTTLIILAVAIVLMVTERLRADIAALLLALALAVAGIISPQEAFSGFSRSAVITIIALFILTQGLYRTGVTRQIGLGLQRLTRGRSNWLLFLTMAAGAALSLFMNNIAAAALLLPAVMDVARRTRTSPSRLLMPLAFGVILGGAATLLTTSNILVGAVLRDQGLVPFGLLDFAPVGIPMLVVGIAYILLVGRRLLPAVDTIGQFNGVQESENQLSEVYALEERLSEVHIPDNSPLVGKTVDGSQIGEKLGLSVVAIYHDGQCQLAPEPQQVLKADDTLLLAGRTERVQQLTDLGCEVLPSPIREHELSNERIELLEITLAPRSTAVGRTLKELHFREKYGLGVVALWRGGRPYRTDVGDMALRFGDALLVHGPRERVAVLRADHEFLVLTEEAGPRERKGWLAFGIMAVTLLVAVLNLLPIAEATMLGALAMVVTGCLTMDDAYRTVEWRAIFLIAGMLPASIALANSGATQWLGQLAVAALSHWGPMALVGGALVLATLLTQILSGQVTAVIVTPVAIAAAQQMNVDPRAIAMAVAMGCSLTFLMPISHPVNVFVMGPGGYRFRDFLRVGLPLTLLEALTVLIFLPMFWPLG